MATATQGTSSEPYEESRGRSGRCPDCRPGTLDSYGCGREAVKARAEYDAAHADGPDPEQYDTARVAYGAARNEAGPVVYSVRQQLEHVTEQIRCLINDSEVVDHLDRAWRRVKRRLRHCTEREGCCTDDNCSEEFDTDVTDHGIEVIEARIAQYEHRTTEAEKCFKRLTEEPDRLRARVDVVKQEVTDLVAEVGGDSATTDYKRLYAKALVADWKLDRIWWGFDHTHDYVDCLCETLQCSLRGRAALSELTGELALRNCMRARKDERCRHLRDNVVDGVIEAYVNGRLPRHPHEDEDSYEEEEPYDDEPAPSYPEEEEPYESGPRGRTGGPRQSRPRPSAEPERRRSRDSRDR
jgi:hypothetical protein